MEVIPPYSVWIVTFVLTLIISSVKCDTNENSTNSNTTNNISGSVKTSHHAEFIRYNVDPITHMEMSTDERSKRASNNAFDRGYEEFLRNYYYDNDIDRKGKYRVTESEPSESNESQSKESNESKSDERSNETQEKRRKNFNKPKHNNSKSNRQRNPNAKKRVKHCKTVKRGNMLCNVCFNPKNDEKSESCSFNSEPKEKNYAYSNDKKVENKNKKGESFEDESASKGDDDDDDDGGSDESAASNEDDEESSDESNEEIEEKGKPTQQHPAPPVRRPPAGPTITFNPRYYPPFLQQPRPNIYIAQRLGPQVFPPPYRGAPVRIQLPPNVALIRHRTIGTPHGNQMIRIITYPDGRSQTQFMTQDYRPPRDVNGAHSQRQFSNVTKDTDVEYIGSDKPWDTANRELIEFLNRDWTNCKRSFEDGQVCFECLSNGNRRKQCMFAGQLKKKPENFYHSYSTMKTIEHNHPYEFEYPNNKQSDHHSKQKHKHHNHHHHHHHKHKPMKNNNSDESDGNHKDSHSGHIVEPAPVYEHLVNDDKTNDGKQRPQAQPLRSAADIIYGSIKPGNEPLALFFNKDFAHFNSTSTTEKSI